MQVDHSLAICHTQVSVDMLLNMDIMLGSLLANSKRFCRRPFAALGQSEAITANECGVLL